MFRDKSTKHQNDVFDINLVHQNLGRILLTLNFGTPPYYSELGTHAILLTTPDEQPELDWGFDATVTRINKYDISHIYNHLIYKHYCIFSFDCIIGGI